MFGVMDLHLLTQDQKERILVDAEAGIARLRAVQLEVLEDLDRCQVATADGCRSLSEWATARLDLHPDTAKTLVRTMRRTVERPEVKEALATGEISFDRAEALSRIPEEVGLLAHLDVAECDGKPPRGSGSRPKTNIERLETSSWYSNPQ